MFIFVHLLPPSIIYAQYHSKWPHLAKRAHEANNQGLGIARCDLDLVQGAVGAICASVLFYFFANYFWRYPKKVFSESGVLRLYGG